MYNSIAINNHATKPRGSITESFSIDLNQMIPDYSIDSCQSVYYSMYMEAVFSSGKETIKPIEDQFRVIKELLMRSISDQDESIKSARSSKSTTKVKEFDPKSFWKSQEFKKLEELFQNIFGFHGVTIMPYIEKYNSKTKDFESKEINCYTYSMDRYPIDGLVTDKGFYDKTHSIKLEIHITLGIIKLLEPDELTAIILHEIGHNIDPALVSISYAETNIISKYLTDRNTKLSKAEKKLLNSSNRGKLGIASDIAFLLALTAVCTIGVAIGALIKFIGNLFIKTSKEKADGAKGKSNQVSLKKLKELIEKDAKTKFNRKDYTEAFADNFARMYGYGPALSSMLKKVSKSNESIINSRYKREKDRQKCIMTLLKNTLSDVHKTEIHRIKSLIDEYYSDINNPDIPAEVKKQLREDVEEVEKILDSYTNDFSKFQNNLNKMLIDAIDNAPDMVVKDDTNDSNDTKKDSADSVIEESLNDCMREFYRLLWIPNYYTEATDTHDVNAFKKRWNFNQTTSTIKHKDREFKIDLNTDIEKYKFKYKILGKEKETEEDRGIAAVFRTSDGPVIVVNKSFWNYSADEQDVIILHEIGHIVCQMSPRPFPKSVKEFIESIKRLINKLIARIRALKYSGGIHGRPFNEIEADIYAMKNAPSPELVKKLLSDSNISRLTIEDYVNKLKKDTSNDKIINDYNKYLAEMDRKHPGKPKPDFDKFKEAWFVVQAKRLKSKIDNDPFTKRNDKDVSQRVKALNDAKLVNSKHFNVNDVVEAVNQGIEFFDVDDVYEESAGDRPVTTLFLLSSLDGKISTGSSDERDVDKDFPQISGLKEGLNQYYDIELTTDLWSLNSGRVQAKIGVNTKALEKMNNPVVSFAVIDNKNLTEHGVRYLCSRTKQTVIITSNKSHPAYTIQDVSNLHIMEVNNLENPDEILRKLYSDYGCKRITVQTGSTLNSLLLRKNVIDYIDLVIAPVIIGGVNTPGISGGDSLNSGSDLGKLSILNLRSVKRLSGSYLRLRYKVSNSSTFTESRKAYEDLLKRKKSLTPSERKEIKELFGDSRECSFAKDNKGYYCYTHRCRSDSYPRIKDIPIKSVNFVRSTS